ncbi:MAG: bifunctional hydroxymethylpyrimidine kinase/phosphomethylpyrimidine kinase [Acidobacteria bacterium]|nr:bifunctional hydroxymethylpyrimidine kinase/phosphomethylpyrimidine kinase [Acidobacteriota bacterium]
MSNTPRVCLTIAGLDPSGGAGVIADIKTFRAFGCFPAAAVTSLTFQNTVGVYGAEHQTAATLRGQVQPIIDDYNIDAVKTGMLPTLEVIAEAVHLITTSGMKNIVVDPVVRSTSGFDLIRDEALRALIAGLFPIADLITPNIPEAERISEMVIKSESDIRAAARKMQSAGARNVLIKGGHRFESTINEETGGNGARLAIDHLFLGERHEVLVAEFIETTATHGTGCTLSAAIAANLALGFELIESVRKAKQFVTEAIRTSPNIGKGNSPINI